MYQKGDSKGLLGKKGTYENRLIGAVKFGGEVLANPLVQAGVTALNPEVGGALMLAKKAGLLKKK
jgi:hypothetical protein